MTITIIDEANRPLSPSQLAALGLWNDTMSHICATVIARMEQEEGQNVS